MEAEKPWKEEEEEEMEFTNLQVRQRSRHGNTISNSVTTALRDNALFETEEDNADEKGSASDAGVGEAELEKSVCLDRVSGPKFTDQYFGSQSCTAGCLILKEASRDQGYVSEKNFDIQKSQGNEIKHEFEGSLKDESSHDITPLPSTMVFEESMASIKPVNGETTKAEAHILEEGNNEEITELDIERVIKEQETHDLFCPNCNSCITRRVILRKRKRSAQKAQTMMKSDQTESKFSYDLSVNPGYPATDEGLERHYLDNTTVHAASEDNRNTETEMFRCLSCFSFFIPSENGFRVLWFLGERNKNQDVSDLQPTATVNTTQPSPYESEKAGMTIDQEKDVVLVVEEERIEAEASERAQLQETEIDTENRIQGDLAEHAGAPSGGVHGMNILKSIVYGGLIESITSLGIITSAAGADAATLKILAMGLANLIGGLFIIGHNLLELKNVQYGEEASSSNQTSPKQVDRCEELLGRREKFPRNATVAVLSFIFFGLLPPVIYGFSFRKSDERVLKLAVASAVSLACVILLALGKAHVQRPPKSYIKTVVYYFIIGLMVSGASYLAGSLIEKLLQELDLFGSSSSGSITLPGIKPAKASSRESY